MMMNYEILKSATKALRQLEKFIFTALNGLFPLYHSVEKFCASAGKEGNATYRSNTLTTEDFEMLVVGEIQ